MTEMFYELHRREREGKTKNRKRRQNKLLDINVLIHNTPGHPLQHLKKLAQMGAGKSVTDFFVREKVNWTNKGTDKQYVAISFIHSTTYQYKTLYQISRS